MSGFNAAERYAYVRGFNFQPPWGSNGRDIWLHFDGKEYARIIDCAKAAFPKLNTLRVWLSFDAWYDDSELFIKSVAEAARIIADAGLKLIPVYFNGWRSIPDFGGFNDETLRCAEANGWEPMLSYARETCEAVEASGAVLMHDLSNEPLNNVLENETVCARTKRFLTAAAGAVRPLASAPLTISSQGYWFNTLQLGCKSDLELFNDIVDVFAIHPYSVAMTPKEKHGEWVGRLIDEASRLGKPVIVTECCWDDDTDEARGEIVKLELGNYAAAGLGFLVHALSPSKVADLHPKGGKNPSFYMPFMLLDGTIRPYHEVFNNY